MLTRLHIAEGWSWRGDIDVIVRDAATGRVKRHDRFPNLIVNGALNAVAAHLRGDTSTDLQITYIAVGDDATAPAAADATLGNETFRKAATKQANDGTGKTRTELFIAAAEAVGTIEELGWFAGAASGTTDSGLLVARVLYSHTKTASETITIVRTDTLARS